MEHPLRAASAALDHDVLSPWRLLAVSIVLSFLSGPRPVAGGDPSGGGAGVSACDVCQAGSIACGQTASGELGVDGCVDPRVSVYSFVLGAASSVEISLASADFDTQVLLANDLCVPIESNDDCPGGGTDSCLSLPSLAAGTYSIWVTSSSPEAAGDYDLAVDCERLPTRCDECGVGAIGCDQTIEASLPGEGGCIGDVTHVHTYRFEAPGPGVLDLSLSSGEFNTHLVLADEGCNEIAANDDCGETTDSCLTASVAPGLYFITVTNSPEGGKGSYTLAAGWEEAFDPSAFPRAGLDGFDSSATFTFDVPGVGRVTAELRGSTLVRRGDPCLNNEGLRQVPAEIVSGCLEGDVEGLGRVAVRMGARGGLRSNLGGIVQTQAAREAGVDFGPEHPAASFFDVYYTLEVPGRTLVNVSSGASGACDEGGDGPGLRVEAAGGITRIPPCGTVYAAAAGTEQAFRDCCTGETITMSVVEHLANEVVTCPRDVTLAAPQVQERVSMIRVESDASRSGSVGLNVVAGDDCSVVIASSGSVPVEIPQSAAETAAALAAALAAGVPHRCDLEVEHFNETITIRVRTAIEDVGCCLTGTDAGGDEDGGGMMLGEAVNLDQHFTKVAGARDVPWFPHVDQETFASLVVELPGIGRTLNVDASGPTEVVLRPSGDPESIPLEVTGMSLEGISEELGPEVPVFVILNPERASTGLASDLEEEEGSGALIARDVFIDVFVHVALPTLSTTVFNADPVRMRPVGPVTLQAELVESPLEYRQESPVAVFDVRNPEAFAGTVGNAVHVVPPLTVPEPSCPECPVLGDTHCQGLTVSPLKEGSGEIVVRAMGADDSGEAVQYEFTATSEEGETVTVGPQAGDSASLTLGRGVWTITACLDDDAECPDFAGDGCCSESVVVEAPDLVFVRGDVNADGGVPGSTADIIYYANWAFLGQEVPPCLAAADANGDGFAGGTTVDIIYLATFLFLGGTAPPAPFRDCGPGTPADALLGCASHPCAE
jgi:hypothetical protein